MRRGWGALAVFAGALAVMGWRIGETPLGAGYLDPVGRIEAQDEAVYSHAALGMAQRGEWLTPYFMGRYFLYKPPMVYWLSGAAARWLGKETWALRLGSLVAASGVCALVYLTAPGWAGALAAAALALSPLFRELARRNLTDAPAVFFAFLGLWLYWRRAPGWAIGAAVAGTVLTKSTAGLLPLVVISVDAIVLRREWRRTAWIWGVAGALGAPWFAYQLAVHGRWFWAEFVEIELGAWGGGEPPQTTGESALGFYGLRLLAGAPGLALGAACALSGLVRRARVHSVAALGLVAFGGAPLVWQYRNNT